MFIGFILFILIISVSCEKDDICVDGDTPLLVLRFYDAADTSLLKSVTDLRITGIGNGDPVNTFTDRSTTDSVAIPLRVNFENTQFQLIINSDDSTDGTETGNIDTLQFNYINQEVFISRACGFIANFDGLEENLTADDDNWIDSIEIVDTLISSQLNAHVKIFH
ncbi:hypothetical protein EQY75_07575 [Muriicola soli]|uniref:Uncharacterized protein n=1 Tax=Muriicola soli TaxID=2507538 RepID=A0A411EDC6_9FLAO|nr:hypothetical protein EQY75_07575 [Muriicola soli]